MPMSIIAYSKGDFLSGKISSLDELKSVKGDVLWLNVVGEDVLPKLIPHRSVVRAFAKSRGTTRVFVFPDYLFLILHQVYETESGLKREKIGLLLRGNTVVTVQESEGDVFNGVRERIREGEGGIRERNAGYLLFELLEAIVENYVPIIERISSKMEALEAEILAGRENALRKIHGLRREILFMRRTVFPLLEAFRRLRLEGRRFFDEETRRFIDGLHQHVLEVLEILEGQRELANSLVELYYSTVSTRTNEIIRILTVVSTVFIPLTFITGLYGMNFRYMPELTWRYGYFASLFAMLTIAVGMLAYFRKKGWL